MEDSLTRHGERLRILLLLNTLATFASWLARLGCEATGIAQWLSQRNSTRKLYSTLRVGREALVKRWPMKPVSRWLERLRTLPDAVREQMTSVLQNRGIPKNLPPTCSPFARLLFSLAFRSFFNFP
ncbi:hypothetical protein FHY18_003612 [Xanthomonas arboricola]|nr:hypothetical protein [Xanthomonas sp. 3793]